MSLPSIHPYVPNGYSRFCQECGEAVDYMGHNMYDQLFPKEKDMPQEAKQESKQEAGKKFDFGKPRLDLLDREALVQIANVLSFGAGKYGDSNWRKGMSWSRLLAAAMRHIQAFNDGESLDQETGLSHLAHAGCCIMFLLNYEKTYKILDDRHKTEEAECYLEGGYEGESAEIIEDVDPVETIQNSEYWNSGI